MPIKPLVAPYFLTFIGVYFLVVVVLSSVLTRRIHSLRDFFLAGRKLGALPVALSFVASWFGASSTIGSLNAYHYEGISALWLIAIPSALSCLVITFFFSRRVAEQTHLSQPEAIEHHYGKAGRVLLALIILASVTTLIGSQLVAAGKLCGYVFATDLTTATVAVTGLVVLYSMVGGYFAVVATDVLQFVFFTLALLILSAMVWRHGGGAPDVVQHLASLRPASFWDLNHELSQHVFLVLTFVLAWSIAPEMWQRMSSSQNQRMAFRSAGIATACLMLLFCTVAYIGLFSIGLFPKDYPQSSLIAVDLAMLLPHESLIAIVLMGFMAAITSTMDSSVNVGSLTLTRDLYQGFFRPHASEGELLWVSRIATLLVCLPAIWIALYYQDIIRILWVSADIYASTMFFPIIGVLFIKQPGRWSGLLAMLFGGVGMLLGILTQNHLVALPFDWPGWPYSTLLSVFLSGSGFALGYWLFRKQAITPKNERDDLPERKPVG